MQAAVSSSSSSSSSSSVVMKITGGGGGGRLNHLKKRSPQYSLERPIELGKEREREREKSFKRKSFFARDFNIKSSKLKLAVCRCCSGCYPRLSPGCRRRRR